ncbi:MAG: galactosyldiacylglycerol synthase [Anaerolineaceae bacterium]|nr:galactosyldiacylglycerol synthase [Anaerolineaceae bacterium]
MKVSRKPHILFLFSDTGGGHRSAAQAIIEALNVYYPGQVTTEMLDFFVEYAPPPFDTAVDTYAPMAQVPDVWELGYTLSNGKWRSKMMQEVLWPYIRKAAGSLVKEHPCDLFLSVHPIINTPVLRALGPEHKPYIVVVTDMVSTHAWWYNTSSTLTLFSTKEAFDRGLMLGLDAAKMEVVGQPIADKFRRPSGTKADLRKALGWPQDLPVALMVGGGEGMGPIAEMVHAVDRAQLDLMMAVIAGKNETLKNSLENAGLKTPAKIYGFVDNMPDLMNAADVILTKAGPGTISEAFIAGLPIILYSKMPGQEDGNVDFVIDHGAGVWAPEPELVAATLRYWVQNPEIHRQVAAISKSLARPDASKDIATRIIEAVSRSPIS